MTRDYVGDGELTSYAKYHEIRRKGARRQNGEMCTLRSFFLFFDPAIPRLPLQNRILNNFKSLIA